MTGTGMSNVRWTPMIHSIQSLLVQIFFLTIGLCCCFLLATIFYLNHHSTSITTTGLDYSHNFTSSSGGGNSVSDSINILPLSTRLLSTLDTSDSDSSQFDSSDFGTDGTVLAMKPNGQLNHTQRSSLAKYLSNHVSQLAMRAHKRTKEIQHKFRMLLAQLYGSIQNTTCSTIVLWYTQSNTWRTLAASYNTVYPRKSSWLELREQQQNVSMYGTTTCDIVSDDKSAAKHWPTPNNEPNQPLPANVFVSGSITLVHHFEPLTRLLQSPQTLCSLFNTVRKYSVFLKAPLSPLCFALPAHYQQFSDVSDALGYSTNWTVEYGPADHRQYKPIDVFSALDRNRLLELNPSEQVETAPERHLWNEHHTTFLSDPQHQQAQHQQQVPVEVIVRQHLSGNYLHWNQVPVKVRQFVLVTALNPLRVWLYNEGLVLPYRWVAIENECQELENFYRYVEHSYGNAQMVQRIKANARQTILNALIVMEVGDRLLNTSPPTFHFKNNTIQYHLLAFDLVFNVDTAQALVVNIIDANTWLTASDTTNMRIVDRLRLDTFQLILLANLGKPSVAWSASFDALADQLESLLVGQDYVGLLRINCHISHRICLNEHDLQYILRTQKELTNAQTYTNQTFVPLYPKNQNGHYYQHNIRSLLDQILIHLDSNSKSSIEPQMSESSTTNKISNVDHFIYQTERLHSILEMIFNSNQTPTFYSTFHTGSTPSISDYFKVKESFELTNWNSSSWNSSVNDNGQRSLNCLTDGEVSNKLKTLRIIAPSMLALYPRLVSNQSHYTVNQSAPHSNLLVSIEVEVAHCDAWVVLENQYYLQSGIVNFSLGIGDNQITLPLVTRLANGSNQRPLSTYTLHIHRQSRQEQYPLVEMEGNALLDICSLVQDCSLKVYPNLPCGLQPTGLRSSFHSVLTKQWTSSLANVSTQCPDGAQHGRWLVPCGDCSQQKTCVWQQTWWLPYECQHRIPVADSVVANCMQHKTILLIGDSTNRGILHYLVERLNGTLTEADKTHDYKTYTVTMTEPELAITTFHFAYYPKFWLPPPKRPPFVEVLRQLIRQAIIHKKDPIDSNNLVLVVGGVQWLARKHLHIVQDELRGFNLTNATFVVKTLGSGFHQPVHGVHYMPTSEQRKLAVHNQDIVSEARRIGSVKVVDTFNKTISLYQDFYPGKCACHFHEIVKRKHPHWPKDNSDRNAPSPPITDYHVQGPLNRLYSEILLEQICTEP